MTDPQARFARWARDTADLSNAVIARPLAGGNANVTSLVETDDGPMVLRHPPADTVSDNAAAGIAREYRFVSAIHGHAPVAPPVAFCEDDSVIGAPFSLTRFVGGTAITETLPPAYPDTIETRNAIGVALICALADLHRIDPLPEGLGDAERARSFVPRQVERWRSVRAQSACRDLPQIERVGAWLAAHCPEPEAIRIVHCDYHLDNVLMDDAAPRVNAILDWEMATLADPLVDLGLVTAMWHRDEATNPGFRFVQRISNAAGVMTGEELAQVWSRETGLSIRHLAYFQAFAMWRLAAIVEGAFVLHRAGQVDGAYERGLEHDVPNLLAEAERFALAAGMA